MKQTYTIAINGNLPQKAEYYLSHQAQNVRIEFAVAKQKATIVADDDKPESQPLAPEKFLKGDYRLYAQALKKALLFHYILHSAELKIKNIHITCIAKRTGKVVYEWHKEFSGTDRPLQAIVTGQLSSAFPQSWKQSKVLKALALRSLTEKEPAWRIAISQIMRHSKCSEIEQFTYNWTAFNATYSWFWELIRPLLLRYAKEHHTDSVARIDLRRSYKNGTDARNLGFLAKAIGANYLTSERRDQYDYEYDHIKGNAILREKSQFENVSDKYEVSKNAEKAEVRIRNRVMQWQWDTETIVSDLKDENSELYQAIQGQLYRHVKSGQNKDTKLYDIEWYQIQPYDFMLFHFCYWLRCSLFHGNLPLTILYFPNEQNATSLRAANAILDDFFAEYYPRFVAEDFFEQKKDVVAQTAIQVELEKAEARKAEAELNKLKKQERRAQQTRK